MTASTRYDCIIVGGGVNGTGIARDAAGRGLSVTLAEQGDLSGALQAYEAIAEGGSDKAMPTAETKVEELRQQIAEAAATSK